MQSGRSTDNFEEMYRDYIADLYKSELIVDEDGFVQYAVLGDKIVVVEVYVKRELRSKMTDRHPFHRLTDKVIEIGKERGCKFITGKIDLSNPHKEKVMKLHLAEGMKLSHTSGNTVWTIKEI